MLHGGDIYTDGLFIGKELLDYSSNINPLGTPEGFSENIGEALKNVVRYPDIKYRELIKNIKAYTGVKNAEIVLGNGAAEIIDLSISCFESILIVVPSFVEYEIDAKKWKCKIEYSYLSEHMEYDYKDIMDKLHKVEAVIIGNPNNPNGEIINRNKFEEILDFCEENGKTIIIDEAFIEFTSNEEHSFTKYVDSYECLFIIRAITKFFAMPGVRFGYGITKNSKLANSIREKQNPWNINCFAELAAKYSFNDKAYIEKSLLWIKEERRFLFDELNKVKCFEKIYSTNANFILCKLKDVNEDELYDFCLKNGIIIRKASNFRGLDKSFIRLAIKDRKANERVIEVLLGYS
jgi:threonine-phosphate decarboxylase